MRVGRLLVAGQSRPAGHGWGALTSLLSTGGRSASRTRQPRPPGQRPGCSRISPMPLSFLLLPSHRPSGENFLAQCASTGKHPVFKAHPADSLQSLGLKPRRAPVPAENIGKGCWLDAQPLGHLVLSNRFHDSVVFYLKTSGKGKALAKKQKKSAPTGKKSTRPEPVGNSDRLLQARLPRCLSPASRRPSTMRVWISPSPPVKKSLANSIVCDGFFFLLPYSYRVARYSTTHQSSASMSDCVAVHPGCHLPCAFHMEK